MKTKNLSNKFWLASGLSTLFIMQSTSAFAGERGRSHEGWARGGSHGGGSHGREVVFVGHERYHYRDGRFFRPGWFGFEFALSIPPVGAVVRVLPYGYRTVIVAGSPYYYDNVYYQTYPSGYVVVPQPVVAAPVVAQSQTISGEIVTINVPNTNGSFTPVTLTKRNGGYVGPQGEYYSGHPTVDQLKALYGK